MALWGVARLAEGIPGLREPIGIPTVATARWIAADRGRRLIFISNYTNAAEGYVRDFIDTEDGARNINLSFGFGRGYPKTRWIIRDGALTRSERVRLCRDREPAPHRVLVRAAIATSASTTSRSTGRSARACSRTSTRTKAQEWLHLL